MAPPTKIPIRAPTKVPRPPATRPPRAAPTSTAIRTQKGLSCPVRTMITRLRMWVLTPVGDEEADQRGDPRRERVDSGTDDHRDPGQGAADERQEVDQGHE